MNLIVARDPLFRSAIATIAIPTSALSWQDYLIIASKIVVVGTNAVCSLSLAVSMHESIISSPCSPAPCRYKIMMVDERGWTVKVGTRPGVVSWVDAGRGDSASRR